LAWLLILADGKAALEVGIGVEIHQSESGLHVFEGAWDGAFEAFGFCGAENFFGTGFSRSGDGFLFSTPTHTLDCLYLLTEPGRVIASNSIAFLYERAGLCLRPGSGISTRLASILKGVNDYDTTLYEDSVYRLQQLAFCNFKIANGQARILKKALAPSFGTYAGYKSYVTDTYARILRNAADSRRKRCYQPLTTISSGYDSTACAAIAARIGCKSAVTIRSSRYGESDSGEEIAEKLGLSCAVFPRANLSVSDAAPEAEFIASGCGGDVALVGFAEHLPGVVLSTGYHGDRVWDPHHTPSDDLKGVGISGSGLTEFRLWLDFIHAPLAFIGAVRHHDLFRIGLSDDMAPYRVGGRYDRPIPRRMVEEAGVPREAFGQRKRVVNILLTSKERMLTPSIRRAVDRMMSERLGLGQILLAKLHGIPPLLTSVLWKLGKQLSLGRGKFFIKTGKFLNVLAIRTDQQYERIFPLTMFKDSLFIVSVEKTAERYRKPAG
jgi:hypothetical protein